MKEPTALVIGGGISGLCSAIGLAQNGIKTQLLEARSTVGGLATGLSIQGFNFDAGPYVLLDLPGLSWAFEQLGLCLAEKVKLIPLDPIYRVHGMQERTITIHHSLAKTADSLESRFPGSGVRYREFVEQVSGIYERLSPLRFKSRPRAIDAFRFGGIKGFAFLLQSLARVLSRSGLPAEIIQTLAIWTHIAGQTLDGAPSPLAFVPALIHRIGAYYPRDGMGAIVAELEAAARSLGVEIHTACPVKCIATKNRRVHEVITAAGAFFQPGLVISACGALTTYKNLLEVPLPRRFTVFLDALPLQSPGVMAYALGRPRTKGEYLSFSLHGQGCHALVRPAALGVGIQNGWEPFRLIAPRHGQESQSDEARLGAILDETWWRNDFEEVKILEAIGSADWGERFFLYRNSMNPVMTPAFLRRGRFPHRCPYVKGLYFAGSSTHPGQWISFCAISGILAARAAIEDLTGKC
jgi:phytoene dehydrogenase-like protein